MKRRRRKTEKRKKRKAERKRIPIRGVRNFVYLLGWGGEWKGVIGTGGQRLSASLGFFQDKAPFQGTFYSSP